MSEQRRGGGLIFCGHRRVGKTVAAAGVARLLHLAGKRVAVFKPVSLETRRSRTGRISHDAELLAGCAESAEPLHQINPIALRGSVPIGFAADGSADVGPQDLIGIAAGMQRDNDVLVVEGLDGLMSPYATAFTELDLMRILDLVMVWIMPPMLAALGPALDALELARVREVRIGGVLINGDRLEANNMETESVMDALHRSTRAPLLGVIQYDGATSVAKGSLGEEILYGLRQVDWLGLLDTAAEPLP